MTLTDHYADARCAAITHAGVRCTGNWSTAIPIYWSHNADTGASLSGPNLVLCHRHRRWTARVRDLERVRVVGGWLGSANEYGYGYAIWSEEKGYAPAREWWAHRRKLTFGESRKDAA